ncbi:glycine/betaine ABC transporter permease [Halomonas cupida]|uniref:Choline/carnitine/betaine transport n=1 Tax=Halomonas cupida TaxID=44933 RepID=A0A1M7J2K9_9GAMM|nr:BCCT family transporter [Halomonas cupida]GEN24290.1 glycine/betaine ABC transporter permease [Halomonas cupida]SHM47205.1 choline/carnitine/betaine transport [Halomonas cupida]
MQQKEAQGQQVFYVSAGIILVLVALGAIFPVGFGEVAGKLLSGATRLFGWFYLLSVFFIVVFLIGLACSKYGKVRLGPQDERPEYGFFSWVSMLLAAGFGVGLVFYGMAEPMSHYIDPPYGDMAGETEASARYAIQYAFFNWGIHQWAGFALVGLIIAYYQFRKDQPGLVSVVLRPLTSKHPRARPYFNGALDVFAVVATVMGVATSVGFGVLQTNGGLHAVFGTPENALWKFIILFCMFCAYMLSTWSGLDKGIKRLSNLNMVMCILLMLYVLFTGPTLKILETITLGLGDYLQNFFVMSLRMSPYDGNEWAQGWTIFYWAWVIAWSPFVGTFVARISRGRTIKEYVFGVLFVPPLLACLWLGVFGGSAIHMELASENLGLAAATQENITVALFSMFDLMPFSGLLSVMAMVLIFIFLVTSADSATYIIAQMTDNGSINPPLFKRVLWGVLMAAICFTLLAAGGLEGLQAASVLAALPFTFILYLMIVVLMRELRKDRKLMLDSLYSHYKAMPVGADAYEARDQATSEGMDPPEEALKEEDLEIDPDAPLGADKPVTGGSGS